MPKALDRLDRRILDELQADARLSNQELAKRVGLSPAPCWRRLRRLEKDGLITGHVTLLNAPGHRPAHHRLRDGLAREPSSRQREAVRPDGGGATGSAGVPFDERQQRLSAAHRRRQHGDYEKFMSTHLLQLRAMRSVNTSFVLRTKKFTTRLPVSRNERRAISYRLLL